MLLLPTSQLFYIRYCIYIDATLTLPWLHPRTTCHQVHYLCLPLYSCPATRFISTIFFLFRFHIYALIYDICFSLSDLLHSVWQYLGPSTSLQMTQFRSFLWLSNITLYICTTSSLSILPISLAGISPSNTQQGKKDLFQNRPKSVFTKTLLNVPSF